MRRLLKLVGWLAAIVLVVVLLLAAPIAYVETACRGEPTDQSFAATITEEEWTRNEAATWLTYPEWHIVYAYEEMAETLRTGDEHDFGYLRSIAGFWSSYCALNEVADAHGGADGTTRAMIYTIGVSFTAELALKALYEETLGRLAVAIRGPEKTPQDLLALEVADDYARFLQQVPWYRYPFADAASRLAATEGGGFRGAERRFALGLEWWAKQAYARLIAQAVAAAGAADLEIRAAASGLDAERLATIDGVEIVAETDGAIVFQAPRYRRFTEILTEIAEAGGTVDEIAGNDDILATVLVPAGSDAPAPAGRVLFGADRQGFGDRRLLLALKVADLAPLLAGADEAGLRVEHVYDY